MKIKKRKKNDRAAFFNLSEDVYGSMGKKARRAWRKPEPAGIPLSVIMQAMRKATP